MENTLHLMCGRLGISLLAADERPRSPNFKEPDMSEAEMTNEPFILRREDVPSFWLVDSLWSVLATADTTGGALSIMDQVMPKGSGPPAHIHP
ncbi:MAG: hypothetical protein JOY89_21105, partial [Solirubrobacterales bacterium]|nr:hypothetical protein [Solirubrobacterales bacterium]